MRLEEERLPFLPFLPAAFGLPFFAALPDGDRSFFAPLPPFFAAASAKERNQSYRTRQTKSNANKKECSARINNSSLE